VRGAGKVPLVDRDNEILLAKEIDTTGPAENAAAAACAAELLVEE